MSNEKLNFNTTSTQENSIKKEVISGKQLENIKEVFKLNPELTQIGSLEQYKQYLQNIFPESKFTDLGHKGVVDNFTEEEKPNFYTSDLSGAKYYSSLREGNKVISAIFNFKNPLIVNVEKPAPIPIIDSNGNFIGSFNDKDINEKIKNAGYDGLILNRKFGNPLDGWEILTFNIGSRYILGSEKDIEQFKDWVKNNEN